MNGSWLIRIAFAVAIAWVLVPVWLAWPAKLLARLHRHGAASWAYRAAAALAPPWWATDLRALYIARASNEALLAGRIDEAVALGMRASLLPAQNPGTTFAVLLPTANALGSRGDPRAEEVWRRALHVANAAGLAPEVAIAQAGLGGLLKNAARYDEAEALLRHALAQPKAASMALAALGEMQNSRGQFGEALATWAQLAALPPSSPRSAAQRRGLVAYVRSQTYFEMGQLDDADVFLKEAESAWVPDVRLRRWCAAARARLDSRRGRAEPARAALEPLLAELPSLADDRRTTMLILNSAAFVFLDLREFARGRDAVARYFATGPDEGARPRMHYCDGMCALGAGEVGAAIVALERAAAGDPQLVYVRKAMDKLVELRARP